MILNKDIQYLPGVGPRKAEVLSKELGVFKYRDLLYYFPYRHIDRSRFYQLSELVSDTHYLQIRGSFKTFSTVGKARNQRLVGVFSDGNQQIDVVWFKGIKYILQNIKPGVEYVLFGKPSRYQNDWNFVHPELEVYRPSQGPVTVNLQPMYLTSEKMKNEYLNSKAILKLQKQMLDELYGQIPESLPDYMIRKLKLMPLNDALLAIHFPESAQQLEKARFRLKFEELFLLQLQLLHRKNLRTQENIGIPLEKVGKLFLQFYQEHLPFSLTGAQKRVIKEIRADLKSGKQMNRLLQGDVGSGKTMVALMCMLLAIDNDYQTCLMAPTEILATQHYHSLKKFLGELPVQIELLTGSTKKKDRVPILSGLEEGSLPIIVGTHALLEETVNFKKLGLVIIDEQHRFGVAQRARLWTKSNLFPHVLVMTATPIPRTLHMTFYGDLDVSVIDELPPGRKPIITRHIYDSKRLELIGFMRKQIQAGRQIYIVYPLIKESEKMDYKDLEDGFQSILRDFPPPNYQVSVVHGKMKAEDKEFEMQRFKRGETQILLATTVIEVGVDVPNATVMIIESAERFGLSQLHQLRGRVGRGGEQSYCLLVSSYALSDEGRKRLQIMVDSNDGFEIAEQDLKLRGPGDMDGTQQSGLAFDLKIANLRQDGQLVEYARGFAEKILNHDPNLSATHHARLKHYLNDQPIQTFNWRDIS